MKSFAPFPWNYLNETLAEGYEAHWPTVLKELKEEFAELVSPCPLCELPARDLTWIPVLTCEESWEEGQGKMGYLTVCLACKHQVDFLYDETSTEIEVATRAGTGGSTSGITWRRLDEA